MEVIRSTRLKKMTRLLLKLNSQMATAQKTATECVPALTRSNITHINSERPIDLITGQHPLDHPSENVPLPNMDPPNLSQELHVHSSRMQSDEADAQPYHPGQLRPTLPFNSLVEAQEPLELPNKLRDLLTHLKEDSPLADALYANTPTKPIHKGPRSYRALPDDFLVSFKVFSIMAYTEV